MRGVFTKGHHSDYEALPTYSIEHRDHDVSTSPMFVLHVSVSPKAGAGPGSFDFVVSWRRGFRQETAIHVLIFDDRQAARKLALYATHQAGSGGYLWHLRAGYKLNRKTRERFVEILIPEVKDELLKSSQSKVLVVVGPRRAAVQTEESGYPGTAESEACNLP